MSDGTEISWSDATWNVVTGCTKVSAGCDHCYIERTPPLRMAGRRFSHQGIGGRIPIQLHPDRLAQPLHWRKPRHIFVCSLADLFHDDIPDDYIARVFAAMALAPQHTFQCLTKRPARMRSLLGSQEFRHQVARSIDAMRVDLEHRPTETWAPIPGYPDYEASTHGRVRRDGAVLKPQVNPRTGRLALSLWRDNIPKTMPVHRLVLLAHDSNGEWPGAEVRHRNGDKTDNRRANLQWGSRSENQHDKVRHGSRGGPAHLDYEAAAQIRAARKSGRTQQSVADQFGVSRSLVSMIESGRVWSEPDGLRWPLPNVWLGVTAEDQAAADLRIPILLRTPAAVRWVSAEPLLGPLDLSPWLNPEKTCERCDGEYEHTCRSCPFDKAVILDQDFDEATGHQPIRRLSWVIAGGESGPNARPMHPDWARSLRDQCAAAGVPFHLKQWGELVTEDQAPDDITLPGVAHRLLDEDGPAFFRVGKKAAGRLLDGVLHDAYPTIREETHRS